MRPGLSNVDRAKQFGYFFREEEADAIRGGNASRIFGLSGK